MLGFAEAFTLASHKMSAEDIAQLREVGFADPDRGLAFAFTTTGQLKPAEYTLWRQGLQSLAFAACRD